MSSATSFINSIKEYPFLDPLEACSIKVGSLLFHSVESLFLAASFADPDVREQFAKCEDGWDARTLHDKLVVANAPRRKDWSALTIDVGQGKVASYLEILRRCWFLRFVQDPEAMAAFVATEYRPIHLDLKLPTANRHEEWLSDKFSNEVLTVVRAQLRELSPSQVAMLKAGNLQGALSGVGGPAASNVPTDGGEFPYLD